jgi:hypothetical protein
MGHKRAGDMRFSQPVTRNVQKGTREVQECYKGSRIHDIIGELFVQFHAAMLVRCVL